MGMTCEHQVITQARRSREHVGIVRQQHIKCPWPHQPAGVSQVAPAAFEGLIINAGNVELRPTDPKDPCFGTQEVDTQTPAGFRRIVFRFRVNLMVSETAIQPVIGPYTAQYFQAGIERILGHTDQIPSNERDGGL